MPIYEYRCSSCGVRKEHLQKISDPKLTVCPECGQETYEKQLTAAGFQLKGSGWYATDFRNGSSSAKSGDTKDTASKDVPSKDAKDNSGSKDAATGSDTAKDGGAKDSGSSTAATPAPAPSSPTTSTGT